MSLDSRRARSTPPDDGLRRQDDRMIADLDKRLALVEQAQQLEHRAAEARWRSLENAIGSLQTDVKTALGQLQIAISEPVQTPAGRQLVADIAEVQRHTEDNAAAIGALEEFRTEIRGGMKLLRGVVAFSAFVSGLAGTIQLLHLFHISP